MKYKSEKAWVIWHADSGFDFKTARDTRLESIRSILLIHESDSDWTKYRAIGYKCLRVEVSVVDEMA